MRIEHIILMANRNTKKWPKLSGASGWLTNEIKERMQCPVTIHRPTLVDDGKGGKIILGVEGSGFEWEV